MGVPYLLGWARPSETAISELNDYFPDTFSELI